MSESIFVGLVDLREVSMWSCLVVAVRHKDSFDHQSDWVRIVGLHVFP